MASIDPSWVAPHSENHRSVTEGCLLRTECGFGPRWRHGPRRKGSTRAGLGVKVGYFRRGHIMRDIAIGSLKMRHERAGQPGSYWVFLDSSTIVLRVRTIDAQDLASRLSNRAETALNNY